MCFFLRIGNLKSPSSPSTKIVQVRRALTMLFYVCFVANIFCVERLAIQEFFNVVVGVIWLSQFV
jgi:hypothetical protein